LAIQSLVLVPQRLLLQVPVPVQALQAQAVVLRPALFPLSRLNL
jgi:hypothetical protein